MLITSCYIGCCIGFLYILHVVFYFSCEFVWILNWGKNCGKVNINLISFEGIIIIIHKCRSMTNEKFTIDQEILGILM